MDDLKKLRNEIDSIDQSIMDLLEKRFKVTDEVGIYKKNNNIDITHSNREKLILDKCENYYYTNEIKEIYKLIFTLSKNNQRG